MPDLRINEIDKELLTQLKMQALGAGKTLRQYVIDCLRRAIKKTAA